MTNFIKELREEILRVACKNNKGHIASSLSCLDMLVALYYEPYFTKDIIILSKGHGCYGLYAIQANTGVIPKEDWENFTLPGCLDGFGSLGHGLPIAIGLAYGCKVKGDSQHVFCIVGDGEMQEGSMWESLAFMKHHDLDNITVIVDNNGLQAMDMVENVLSHNLKDRLEGWGCNVITCDGHNYMELLAVLRSKPEVVIANTIKGNGCKCMENVPAFHYRVPNDHERYCN